MAGKVKITLVRSTNGQKPKMRATAKALGLKKTNASVVRDKDPIVMGMINRIKHMVSVEEL